MHFRIPSILLTLSLLLVAHLAHAQQEYGPERTIRFGDNRNMTAKFNPAGHPFIAVATESHALLLDAESGDSLHRFFDFPSGPIYAALWNPDGDYLGIIAADTAILWYVFPLSVDWWIGRRGDEFPIPHTRVCAWNRSDDFIATCDADSAVSLWSVVGFYDEIFFPSLSNNLEMHLNSFGTFWIFTALQDGRALLWNEFAEEAKPVIWAVEEGLRGTGGAYGAISQDENLIITSNSAPGSPPEVKLWDRATGDSIGVLKGHIAYPTCFVFSKDDKYLVTAGTDSTARLWNLENRSLIGTFRGHTGNIVDVSLSADGQKLVTISTDSTVRIWDLNPLSAPSEPIAESGARLQSLYPNPANKQVVFDFSLTSPASVSVRIVDNLGQEIVALSEKQLEAGQHKVSLDLLSVPSGHYLCLLRAGQETMIADLHVVK